MNTLKSAWQHLHDHFVPNARNSYQPHLVAHRSLHLYAGLLISVKILTMFSAGLLPAGQAFSSAVNVRNILELTNYSRSTYGLDQLNENTLLDQAAQAKASDMVANQYFAHVSPQGKTPWDFIAAQGYNYMVAGENLAINFYSSEGVSQAWMNSPEHKANILNKDFRDIGIGIAEGEYQGVKAIWVVQMFGTSTDRPYTPKNSYTVPQPLLQTKPGLPLPAAAKIALAKPVIDNPGFFLTNKQQIFISGEAPGASDVYILINHTPRADIPSSNGIFYGDITLDEGANTISVVGFDAAAQASPLSEALQIKVDSVAPSIISSQIIPQNSGNSVAYKIEVHLSGDPAKVVAQIGQTSIMLQPTADPAVWTGTVPAGIDLKNPLTVSAYDLAGNARSSRIATFAPDTAANYGFLAEPIRTVNIFGKSFAASTVNNFYLYFVIALLAILIVTIIIRRSIRQVGLIAHTSAMIALAMVLWVR